MLVEVVAKCHPRLEVHPAALFCWLDPSCARARTHAPKPIDNFMRMLKNETRKKLISKNKKQKNSMRAIFFNKFPFY